jgi:tRNA pseudouridine55 synthase
LEELEAMSMSERLACLIPMDKAIDFLNPVYLDSQEIITLRQGRVLTERLSGASTELLRIYDEHQHFIGLGERSLQGDLKAKRLLAFSL